MREQLGVSIDDPEPPRLEPFVGTQPFVLSTSPTHQVGVDALQEGIQLRPVEPTVIVDPARHNRIHLLGKLVQTSSSPQVQSPLTNPASHRGEGVPAKRRQEPEERRSALAQYRPGRERVPEERERRVHIVSPPLLALAVSGSPGESHPRAPTERSVTISRHSALTIQSVENGVSMPSARTGPGRVSRPDPTTP